MEYKSFDEAVNEEIEKYRLNKNNLTEYLTNQVYDVRNVKFQIMRKFVMKIYWFDDTPLVLAEGKNLTNENIDKYPIQLFSNKKTTFEDLTIIEYQKIPSNFFTKSSKVSKKPILGNLVSSVKKFVVEYTMNGYDDQSKIFNLL